MKSLPQILKILVSQKKVLFKNYAIKSLAIFGSVSRNEQTEASDVDIMVEFNKKIGVEFIDLACELEDLLGFKVDLVSKNGIKQEYLNTISSDFIYV